MSASVVQDPDIAVSASLQGPYVGLRPFERTEQSIFFGRHREAGFLRDKIFSARLTLLYAPSGVGKSSILRALVGPALEEQHAWVKHFDNWTGEDPCASLKLRLIKFASELGVQDFCDKESAIRNAGPGSPTLTEIISRLGRADDRTAILILDQFEEFLVAHGKQLDPLKKELAGLVRATGVDVRIVLSLRQEFLAALEPFRDEILNLFRSTYLLDSLDDQGLRDAIEKPVHIFGGEYESALTDRLVSDLRASQDRDALATSTAPVDLPMMQIVCGRLWEAASRRKQTTLTLSLYKQLGGADKILESYVRNVMPKRWSDKRLTARLMKYLAPSSGLKRPYTSLELAENESLSAPRVGAELERLSDLRILRVREYRGQKLYELEHDAFIRFIGPWRDEILRRERLRRRLSRIGIGAAIVLFLVGGYFYSELKHDFDLVGKLRSESPEDRRQNAETNIDTATTDLLFRWKSLALLHYVLKKNGDLIPDGYGLANAPPLQEIEAQDAREGEAPTINQRCDSLCVYYSSARPAEAQSYINAEWRYLATSFFAPRGIPVPLRIQAIPHDGYSPRKVTFNNGTQVLASQVIPVYENSVFISPGDLKGPAKDFFEQYQGDWTEMKADDLGSFAPLIVVPGWSRPAWRVSGSPADDVRGLPAVYFAAELMKNPEALFSDGAMSILLAKAGAICPQTVSEALAARGYDHLRQDFAEMVKRGQYLTDLPTILDRLAAYPAADPKNTSQAVADQIYGELHGNLAGNLPPRLAGPWKAKGEAAERQASPAYQEAGLLLPSMQFPVKVYMGKGLQETWFNEAKPLLNPRLYKLREKLLRQYGVQLRPPLVFSGSASNPLPSNGYRIESTVPRAVQCNVPAVSDPKLEQFIAALEQCIVASRGYWVMAEDAYTQRAGAPALQPWLDGHYSLTDQKLLMRAVVGGAAANLIAPAAASDSIPPESTLRHADWLMRSLIFWSQAVDSYDTAQVVDALRRTQRARLTPPAADTSNQPVSRLVAEGVQALEASQPTAAQNAFAKAVAMDKPAAIQSFLFLYPRSLKTVEFANAAELCSAPTPPYLNSKVYKDFRQRTELNDPLIQQDTEQAPSQARRLGLCLLSSYASNAHQQQISLEASLLKRNQNAEDWTPMEARWLAERILSEYDPYSDDGSLRDKASQLLKSAVVRLPADESRKTFRFVAGTQDQFGLRDIDEPGPKNWRRELLKEVALARPIPANMQDLTVQLLQSDHVDDLKQVLQITDNIAAMEQSEPNRTQRISDTANFLYYRAIALERLSDLGAIDPGLNLPDRRAEVEAILRDLNQYERVRSLHAQFATDRGHYREAIEEGNRLFTSASAAAESDPELYQTMLLAELLTGDQHAAEATAVHAEERASDPKLDADSKSEMLFAAALGEIATHSPSMEDTGRVFLATSHAYVPYIAMMLYSRMSFREQSEYGRQLSEQRREEAEKEAKSVLDERWEKADSAHWKERIRGGDETAWREMLLGLYLDKVKANDIFDPLKDDHTFAASDMHFLPMSRQDMLCEASFYAALLAESKNDMTTRNRYLQQAVSTNVRYYIEYGLAKYMLAASR